MTHILFVYFINVYAKNDVTGMSSESTTPLTNRSQSGSTSFDFDYRKKCNINYHFRNNMAYNAIAFYCNRF